MSELVWLRYGGYGRVNLGHYHLDHWEVEPPQARAQVGVGPSSRVMNNFRILPMNNLTLFTIFKWMIRQNKFLEKESSKNNLQNSARNDPLQSFTNLQIVSIGFVWSITRNGISLSLIGAEPLYSRLKLVDLAHLNPFQYRGRTHVSSKYVTTLFVKWQKYWDTKDRNICINKRRL